MDMDKLFEKLPYEKLYPMVAWQRMAGLAGIVLLVVLLVYLLLISGQAEQMSSLQKDLNDKMTKVRTNERLALRKNEFEKKIAELNEKLVEAKKILPGDKEIPRLLEKISHFGTQEGLEFDTFQPTRTSQKDFYSEIPVALKVHGKFHSILAFFDEISHMDRIVTINNVKMTRKKKKKGYSRNITLECDAITYRYIEGSEIPKDPKAKKAGRKR